MEYLANECSHLTIAISRMCYDINSHVTDVVHDRDLEFHLPWFFRTKVVLYTQF